MEQQRLLILDMTRLFCLQTVRVVARMRTLTSAAFPYCNHKDVFPDQLKFLTCTSDKFSQVTCLFPINPRFSTTRHWDIILFVFEITSRYSANHDKSPLVYKIETVWPRCIYKLNNVQTQSRLPVIQERNELLP